MTLDEYHAEITKLYELWCDGDEAKLKEVINEAPPQMTSSEKVLYEEYTNAMSTKRNAQMVQKAIEYLESDNTVFYAVGLAHVLNDDGLVNELRNAGYTVELVPTN